MKAVLDIGKTNAKLIITDDAGLPLHTCTRPNQVRADGPYPHADISGLWDWLIASLRGFDKVGLISQMAITTHGATAALIDPAGVDDDGLVLPVLDYEFEGINTVDAEYNALRPDFAETLSPNLPCGLNLGRQVFWLSRSFPEQFARARHLLMYPQYWGWRLTGQLASEVTSLGCHTDLWAPGQRDYSRLVGACGWQPLFPPLAPAAAELGTVSAAVAERTGLPGHCRLRVGIHDSNASYLRYLHAKAESNEPFTVISTGTWTILMQAQGQLEGLDEQRDMLANCDAYSDPIACARFMGGREYEVICQRLGGNVSETVSAEAVQNAIDQQWMATPDFSGGNGPFGGKPPGLHCPEQPPAPGAIATLYCALMIDQRLTDLGAHGPLYMEGSFLKNPLLCALVAQLRPGQPLYLSSDDTGTVQGALLLTGAESGASSLALNACPPSTFEGLENYRQRWYARLA
ncbi:FGGY-family carbohydrate kinase [Marinimicrobium alkaliphilum]|uniref:FGGY-family carbohydrate kinase n=1 Tax=Marinimicrobium alkaliphilum TaxID=2202654 RepID=UPI000DBA98B6|nr:FGGY family carbohydrate kinase [Marinimicrobium alkaliphilum]